ncbi:hypothetical protein [Mesorhizobium sp. B2-3-4]|uniref:hypothetical protein n=1 Tax=Mesorhizobium sp. B2-3-4 TaxID=2589959 RepID=UPI0011298B3A|nr:hypothetical protein [Mesorhizobium sp. B2-3-4]TPM26990.1 hypothetical protein FJ967_30730 [Mesorhizobium sp. B2-3-4]
MTQQDQCVLPRSAPGLQDSNMHKNQKNDARGAGRRFVRGPFSWEEKRQVRRMKVAARRREKGSDAVAA